MTLLPLLTPGIYIQGQHLIKLDTGLIMIRKSNKLPGKKIYSYDLEYGSDTLEVNINAQNKNVE